MEFNFSKLVSTIVFAAGIVFVAACGMLLIYPKWQESKNLEKRNEQLKAQIDEKRREIEKYKTYQRRFMEDPDFVESIARRNKRVFPGETVFIFEE